MCSQTTGRTVFASCGNCATETATARATTATVAMVAMVTVTSDYDDGGDRGHGPWQRVTIEGPLLSSFI